MHTNYFQELSVLEPMSFLSSVHTNMLGTNEINENNVGSNKYQKRINSEPRATSVVLFPAQMESSHFSAALLPS